MRTIFGGFPPRYGALLRLSLAAAALRLILWVPFCLAYFLPLGVWSKLLVLFSPFLWVTVVVPVRVRYGEILAAFAGNPAAPLQARDLFFQNRPWQHVVRERLQLTRLKVLPLLILTGCILLPLWAMNNVFAAIKLLLSVPAWIASAAATAVLFIPRVITGGELWVDAGVLGGAAVLLALFAAAIALHLWAMFQTGAYRFGFQRLPKRGTLKPLLKKNLLLWLPALILFAVLLAFAWQELLLLAANVLSIEPVFTVTLQPPQIALLALTAASYLLLLPLRKYNVARWAKENG